MRELTLKWRKQMLAKGKRPFLPYGDSEAPPPFRPPPRRQTARPWYMQPVAAWIQFALSLFDPRKTTTVRLGTQTWLATRPGEPSGYIRGGRFIPDEAVQWRGQLASDAPTEWVAQGKSSAGKYRWLHRDDVGKPPKDRKWGWRYTDGPEPPVGIQPHTLHRKQEMYALIERLRESRDEEDVEDDPDLDDDSESEDLDESPSPESGNSRRGHSKKKPETPVAQAVASILSDPQSAFASENAEQMLHTIVSELHKLPVPKIRKLYQISKDRFGVKLSLGGTDEKAGMVAGMRQALTEKGDQIIAAARAGHTAKVSRPTNQDEGYRRAYSAAERRDDQEERVERYARQYEDAESRYGSRMDDEDDEEMQGEGFEPAQPEEPRPQRSPKQMIGDVIKAADGPIGASAIARQLSDQLGKTVSPQKVIDIVTALKARLEEEGESDPSKLRKAAQLGVEWVKDPETGRREMGFVYRGR